MVSFTGRQQVDTLCPRNLKVCRTKIMLIATLNTLTIQQSLNLSKMSLLKANFLPKYCLRRLISFSQISLYVCKLSFERNPQIQNLLDSFISGRGPAFLCYLKSPMWDHRNSCNQLVQGSMPVVSIISIDLCMKTF